MKIAIASGKGGTGKSTLSTNLAYLLSKRYTNVALIDCDVEEPNCHIFVKPQIIKTEEVHLPTPKVDSKKCISCGKCAEVCQFNALAFARGKVLVFDELCHGCGSCMIACPSGAITENQRTVGEIRYGKASTIEFAEGKLKIGEAKSPPLINAVKEFGEAMNNEIQILDCPPGTSCPVISAIDGVDFVIMVTEPTPFGLNDLKLAVEVVKKMSIPFGVVINRSEENNTLIEDWAREKEIKILTKIPNERRIAENYSKGNLILKDMPEFEKYFTPLLEIIKEEK